jgi:hypothetical protein
MVNDLEVKYSTKMSGTFNIREREKLRSDFRFLKQ